VIVTLANQGKLPAKVVVKSEIPGYTDQAVDTVDLGAGETLEVRQNPLLLPEVIDQLNVEKPAQVHIQVAALENGDEKTILEETGETTIYARRDFPLGIEGFTESEVLEFFAAMVTPNDPSVEELIRKAANYTESGIIWMIPGHAYVGIRTDQQNANYYFVETMPHLEAQESGYGWVKIWDAREHGILPLPWR
jgi:hypothetical protein